MKILKNRTYRRLVAAEHDLELLKEKHDKLILEYGREVLKTNAKIDEISSLQKQLTEARVEIAKYLRKRDPQTGRFTE